MSARKKNKGINLLPVDRFSLTTAGRILKWLLGTFRYIVIVVEMIVMLAFLSRFWLDAKNADLNDEIRQKKARIEASQGTEKEILSVQKKLKAFLSLATLKTPPSDLLKKISPLIPSEVILSSISINPKGIVITGNSFTEVGILQTIANLKSDKFSKNVSLQSVSIDENNGNTLKFTINIEY